MKLLIEKSSNVVICYALHIELYDDKIMTFYDIGSATYFDRNETNSYVAEVAEIPEDFTGHKYKYINGELILNEV